MAEAGTTARVVIVGGGPAGMMAAETIATHLTGGVSISIVERMPSPARKFLMAGRGGLNLTHSEDLGTFLERYRGSGGENLSGIVKSFCPGELTRWSEDLGQPTFVGSSGRVFPKAFKASPLLRAWLARLAGLGVTWRLRTRWLGWDEEGRLLVEDAAGRSVLDADAVVLALGGGSWPRLGSDGLWTPTLVGKGVVVRQLAPSNVGFDAAWTEHFRDRFAGQPVKGVRLQAERSTARGEVMITRSGVEGGAIYALSGLLREQHARDGVAEVVVDLKPDLAEEELASRLARARPGLSMSNLLRKALTLSPVAIGLLQEVHRGALPRDPPGLARQVKGLRLRLTAPGSISRAISTAGGVDWSEVDERLMLKRLPGVFAAGEMLDWEAPTGGYLLQACFATGRAAGQGVVSWLGERALATGGGLP